MNEPKTLCIGIDDLVFSRIMQYLFIWFPGKCWKISFAQLSAKHIHDGHGKQICMLISTNILSTVFLPAIVNPW